MDGEYAIQFTLYAFASASARYPILLADVDTKSISPPSQSVPASVGDHV